LFFIDIEHYLFSTRINFFVKEFLHLKIFALTLWLWHYFNAAQQARLHVMMANPWWREFTSSVIQQLNVSGFDSVNAALELTLC